ncbi:hypothetical protein BZG36_02894 [Bifiguratus adelaidae]|uniref:Protein kinase domain-containing protein n=1 Tax=Bifiguratus adelaidae TaxID=1938954 RepID=A0A261Y233_9FUNG|nr:hypothetical protein BZG36_02894 [Bifiguratus adelaidae]
MLAKLLTVLAFVSCAVAQLYITQPVEGTVWQEGTIQTIRWLNGTGPITINLRAGPTEITQQIVETIVSNFDAAQGSFQWTVSTNLPSGNAYAIEIDGTYSHAFSIAGGMTTLSYTVNPASRTPISSSTASALTTKSMVSATSISAMATNSAASSSLSATASSTSDCRALKADVLSMGSLLLVAHVLLPRARFASLPPSDETLNKKEQLQDFILHMPHKVEMKPVTFSKGQSVPKRGAGENPDLLLHGITSYEFIGTLGTGKFSKVKLGRNVHTYQLAAVKIIDKRTHDDRVLSRLVREITLMELLDHPNIVKLYEVVETKNSLFLIMEYVEGCNLDEYLQQRGGRLKESEARYVFRQIVAAISHCHSRWVCHRDLKTPNILIGRDGQVKIADFGLGNRFGINRLRTICGSMLYYSPEIISGYKYYGSEVDNWCLGIALFRMTAGFEPFAHATTVGELKKDVCGGNYKIPSSLSEELKATITRLLALDRKQRMSIVELLSMDDWVNDFGRLPSVCTYDNFAAADGDASGRRRTRHDEYGPSSVRKVSIIHPIELSTYYLHHGDLDEANVARQEKLEAFKDSLVDQSVTLLTATTSVKLNVGKILSRMSGASKRALRANPEDFESISARTGYGHRLISKDYLCRFALESFSLDPQSSPYDNAYQLGTRMLNILKKSCELFGITYVFDGPNRLLCVLETKVAINGPRAQSKPNPDHDIDTKVSSSGFKSFFGGMNTLSNGDIGRPISTQLLSSPLSIMKLTTQSSPLSDRPSFRTVSPSCSKSTGTTLVSQAFSSMMFTDPSDLHNYQDRLVLFRIEAILPNAPEFANPKPAKLHSFGKPKLADTTLTTSTTIRFSRIKGSNEVFKMAISWLMDVIREDYSLPQ